MHNHSQTILVLLIGMIFSISCSPLKKGSVEKGEQPNLSTLAKMMTGQFSSSEQARMDSTFYNINLVMFPIWENDKRYKWLYVEQAVTRLKDKPYRQRVYKLSNAIDGKIESKVFALHNPAKYIHAWKNPEIFNQINADSLLLREGCAVFLEKKENCYAGSTKNKSCSSSLRGAKYATSQVSICKDEIYSWDQGWNENDEQVWGAEKKGYVFKRITFNK